MFHCFSFATGMREARGWGRIGRKCRDARDSRPPPDVHLRRGAKTSGTTLPGRTDGSYAGMLFNGLGRPIDLSRPCQTLPASMGGNKTPIIDTRLLRDGNAEDWLVSLHAKILGGTDTAKLKVPAFMRRITVSEAAALQGFPPDFVFCGSQCERYRQIGNSVPPPFAEHVARAVVENF